jgi:hypothetical protein
MTQETKLETKLNSELQKLKNQLNKIKDLQSAIANDWGLKSHIGILERDNILDYYTKERFRIEEKIKLLKTIIEGE